MMVTVIHLHGPDQAIAVCDRIERGLHEAAGRAQRACQEAAQELKHMLNLIKPTGPLRGALRSTTGPSNRILPKMTA